MVKINDKYFDGNSILFLDKIKDLVSKKWDGLFYIGGKEGSGKTTLALQFADYLDTNFDLNKVVFTGEQFMQACNKANRGDCIVFDESYMIFNSGSHASKETIRIKSMLTMIRSKQLYLLIVSPTFFDINKYLILHRARCFVNVYDDQGKRGFYSYYNSDKKAELYHKGKKDHNMKCVAPLMRGRFTNWSPVDEEQYEAKKQEAISALLEDSDKVSNVRETKLVNLGSDKLIIWLRSKNLLKRGAMALIAEDYYRVNHSSLSHRLKAKIKEEEICL